jgi:hypothetical protein
VSTAVIKSIQVAGSTVEVLAVADDGVAYRVQTDGTLASLKAALQQATKKASDIRTKPEIAEGMTVDFTPAAVVIDPPAKLDAEREQWFAEKADHDTQLALARYPADFAARYKPDYGNLR